MTDDPRDERIDGDAEHDVLIRSELDIELDFVARREFRRGWLAAVDLPVPVAPADRIQESTTPWLEGFAAGWAEMGRGGL